MGSPPQRIDPENVTYGTTSIDVVLQLSVPLQNQLNRHDVTGDGRVTPLDALMIVNDLNNRGSRTISVRGSGSSTIPSYLDVSGDNIISPLDALLVINFLNFGFGAEPEPVSPAASGPASQPELPFDYWLPSHDDDDEFEDLLDVLAS
jgi:hypothetical protein